MKFRVWDSERNVMLDPDDAPIVNPKACGNLIWCDMECVAMGSNGMMYLIDECGNYEYAGNRFTKMWSTGATDVKGIKLFESDICEYMDDAGRKQVGVVRYHNCAWWLFAKGGDDEGNQNVRLGDAKCKKIGDIYNKIF